MVKAVWGLLGFGILAVTALPAQAEIVARVNGETISRAALEEALELLPPQIREAGVERIYPQLLEEMIGKKLLNGMRQLLKTGRIMIMQR